METWSLDIRHEAEPTTDAGIEMTLAYKLADAETLIGISPNERHAEIRRQLLAGPLDALGDATSDDIAADCATRSELAGQHHLSETGAVSGDITLTGGINAFTEHAPEALIGRARAHIAKALASDIACGLETNIVQKENAGRANDQHSVTD